MMGLLLFLVAGIGTPSDEKKPVDVVCPVDGTKFIGYEVSSNRWGGQDADFCPHALKTTPMELWIWVCPTCHFAGRPTDFKLKLADSDRRALQEQLKPVQAIKPGAKQTEVPGHVKYDLVAQAARIRSLGPEQAGLAWLHASWCARQQGAVDFQDFDEWDKLAAGYGLAQTPMQLGPKKNRTDFDLDAAKRLVADIEGKKYEKGPNRILARYLAAFLYRKHGENVEARRWLDEVEKLKGENSVVDDASAKMRASFELEASYQARAIDAYIAAIDSKKLEKRIAAEAAYVIAELFRRQGQTDSAASWYQSALDSTDSEELKKLALQQKAKLGK